MIIIESEFFYYNLFIQTLLKLLEIQLKKQYSINIKFLDVRIMSLLTKLYPSIIIEWLLINFSYVIELYIC